jgi:hypothetical protein
VANEFGAAAAPTTCVSRLPTTSRVRNKKNFGDPAF